MPPNICVLVASFSVPQQALASPFDPSAAGTGHPVNASPSASPSAKLRALVEAHFALVWRTARGFGVAGADADDIAQQVFVTASQKIDAIEAGTELAFLIAITRGLAANYRRSKGRKPEAHDEEAILALVDTGPNVEDALDDQRARRLLDHVITLLPDDLREVFVLFELEEISTAEIAAIVGVPVGTVASRLRRAREDFHAHVRRIHAQTARMNR
jgi:RNA polymerase sigma-70 factor (ECF subfamily)